MTTYLGEDYTVKATITDKDSSLIDADSHDIVLKDPSGTVRAMTTEPNKISLGVWEATLPIPEDGAIGVWSVE